MNSLTCVLCPASEELRMGVTFVSMSGAVKPGNPYPVFAVIYPLETIYGFALHLLNEPGAHEFLFLAGLHGRRGRAVAPVSGDWLQRPLVHRGGAASRLFCGLPAYAASWQLRLWRRKVLEMFPAVSGVKWFQNTHDKAGVLDGHEWRSRMTFQYRLPWKKRKKAKRELVCSVIYST